VSVKEVTLAGINQCGETYVAPSRDSEIKEPSIHCYATHEHM